MLKKVTLPFCLFLATFAATRAQDTMRYALSTHNEITVVNDTQILNTYLPTRVISESISQVNDSNGNILLVSNSRFIYDDKNNNLNPTAILGGSKAAEQGCILLNLQDSLFFIATTPYHFEDTGWEYSLFTYTKESGSLKFLKRRVGMNQFKVNEPVTAVESADGNFWIILTGTENNQILSHKLMRNGHLFKKPVISNSSLDYSQRVDRQNKIIFNKQKSKCAIYEPYNNLRIAYFNFDLHSGKFSGERILNPGIYEIVSLVIEDSTILIYSEFKVLTEYNLNSGKKDTFFHLNAEAREPFAINDSIYLLGKVWRQVMYIWNRNKPKELDSMPLHTAFEGNFPFIAHQKPYDLQTNLVNEKTLRFKTDSSTLLGKTGIDTLISLGNQVLNYNHNGTSYPVPLKSGISIIPNDSFNCHNANDTHSYIKIKSYHTLELEDGTVLQSDSLNIDSFLGKKIYYMDSNGLASTFTLHGNYQPKIKRDWRYLSVNPDIELDTTHYTYSWYKDGSLITKNILRFRADSSGDYLFKVSNKIDSCLIQTDVFTHQITSRQKINKARYSVYPNPTQNHTYIEFNNGNVRGISLFDLSGKQILHQKVNSSKITLKDLSPGTYLLIIHTHQPKNYYEKIIKLD